MPALSLPAPKHWHNGIFAVITTSAILLALPETEAFMNAYFLLMCDICQQVALYYDVAGPMVSKSQCHCENQQHVQEQASVETKEAVNQ